MQFIIRTHSRPWTVVEWMSSIDDIRSERVKFSLENALLLSLLFIYPSSCSSIDHKLNGSQIENLIRRLNSKACKS